jgi:hypothetical protein
LSYLFTGIIKRRKVWDLVWHRFGFRSLFPLFRQCRTGSLSINLAPQVLWTVCDIVYLLRTGSFTVSSQNSRIIQRKVKVFFRNKNKDASVTFEILPLGEMVDYFCFLNCHYLHIYFFQLYMAKVYDPPVSPDNF